jgi:hypothetical protein
MTTGRYQCLKPQGETIMMRYASEFTTALRMYAAAQSFQLPSLCDLARREMIALGDRLSLPSLVDIMEESSLSLSTLTGIAAYVESRILAFAENITYPTSEKVLSEIGTPNTLSMVLLKTILLLQTSKVSLRDDSLRKGEPVPSRTTQWTPPLNGPPKFQYSHTKSRFSITPHLARNEDTHKPKHVLYSLFHEMSISAQFFPVPPRGLVL